MTRLLPKLACTGSYHLSGWPLSTRILTRHYPHGNVAQVNARIRMQSRSHRVVLYNTRISGCVHSMVSSSKSVHGKNLRRGRSYGRASAGRLKYGGLSPKMHRVGKIFFANSLLLPLVPAGKAESTPTTSYISSSPVCIT